jgi:hypothetical protein
MDKAATKRNKKEKKFFCLCKKGGYSSTTALHTHVKQKHKDEERFKQHYKQVYDEFVW